MKLPWDKDFQYYEFFTDTKKMMAILNYEINPEIDYEKSKATLVCQDDSIFFLRGLSQYPVLTRHGEKMLFLKMNYAKYRAAQCEEKRDSRGYKRFMKVVKTTRSLLINHNLKLVVSIMKKYCRSLTSLAEAVSDGYVSLIYAIDKFDTMRLNKTGSTNKFSTYATWAITNNSIRARKKKEITLEYHDTQTNSAIDDTEYDENTDTGLVDKIEKLKYLMNVDGLLDDRSKMIISKRFGFSGKIQTLTEIGHGLGISKERVRQIIARSVEIMREYLQSTPEKPNVDRRREKPIDVGAIATNPTPFKRKHKKTTEKSLVMA